MREGIHEDFDHDPSFEKQRRFSRYAIGLLVNALAQGEKPLWGPNVTKAEIVKTITKQAELIGVVFYDDLHHAPACRANHWHRQQLPWGPCTCGADRA